jgi:Na+-driven multidrug efflux pump
LVPLAALGPNAALFSALYFLFFTALSVICTQAMAAANSRGDAEGIGRGLVHALAASLAISVPLALLLILFPEPVLTFFQTNAEIMADARTYARIR